jgi:hypothetical protein
MSKSFFVIVSFFCIVVEVSAQQKYFNNRVFDADRYLAEAGLDCPEKQQKCCKSMRKKEEHPSTGYRYKAKKKTRCQSNPPMVVEKRVPRIIKVPKCGYCFGPRHPYGERCPMAPPPQQYRQPQYPPVGYSVPRRGWGHRCRWCHRIHHPNDPCPPRDPYGMKSRRMRGRHPHGRRGGMNPLRAIGALSRFLPH